MQALVELLWWPVVALLAAVMCLGGIWFFLRMLLKRHAAGIRATGRQAKDEILVVQLTRLHSTLAYVSPIQNEETGSPANPGGPTRSPERNTASRRKANVPTDFPR